jgi:hypothetical protein
MNRSTTNKNINLIIYSKGEEFLSGAEKIQQDTIKFGKQCEIYEIDDFIENINEIINKNIIRVYFLTGDCRIQQLVNIITKQNQLVINSTFLSCEILSSKYDSLMKVSLCGVHIPDNLLINDNSLSELNRFPIPLFIKSKSPRGIVTRIESIDELISKLEIVTKNERSEIYLERDILTDGFTEIKLYYVNDMVYVSDSENLIIIPEWLKDILHRISRTLEIEVFSTDLTVNWSSRQYYCFDINYASSFFMCAPARIEFINKILI